MTISFTAAKFRHCYIFFFLPQCSRIDGVRAFIDQIRDDSMIRHMIIGPGCSTGAVTIAETVPFYNLTQVRLLEFTVRLQEFTSYC